MCYKCSLLVIIHEAFHFAAFEDILPIVGLRRFISFTPSLSHLGKIVNFAYLLTCDFVDLDTTVFNMSVLQALQSLLLLHKLVISEYRYFLFNNLFLLLISSDITILAIL